MRVLRIFHSAVVDAWRERERHLRVLGAEVDLLTARRWNEGGSDVTLVPRPGEPVRGIRTWGRHPALFVYSPLPLWRALGRAYDVIDIHEEPFALATAEILLLRRLRRQRAPYVLYSAQNIDKRYPPPFRWLERWALRHAAGLSVCNTEAGRICERKGLPGSATLIPLGVDVERFSPAPAGSSHGTVPVVGYVGRLEPHKGVDVLLEAVARLDAVELRVAGAGPEEERVASPYDGARPRPSRRVRRVARPGPAPGVLPRPRRPGRPVAPDARLARAVRARGRRGHGVRRTGRRQRHRCAARRRGRGRAAGAARRPGRAGRLPRDPAEGRARPTRAGAAWGRAGPARVVVGGGACLPRPLRASDTHPGDRAPRRRSGGGRLRPAGPPGRLAAAGADVPGHGRRQLVVRRGGSRLRATGCPLPRPREQRGLRSGREPRAGPPARPGRRRAAPQPRRRDRVRRRAAAAPCPARRPDARLGGAYPGRRGRTSPARSRGRSRRRLAPGWWRPGSVASVAPAAS